MKFPRKKKFIKSDTRNSFESNAFKSMNVNYKHQSSPGGIQWRGIRLPMQGTQVPSLVCKDPKCLGAEARAPQFLSLYPRAHKSLLQSLRVATTEVHVPRACAGSKRSHCNDKTIHCNEEQKQQRPMEAKINNFLKNYECQLLSVKRTIQFENNNFATIM